MEVEEGYKYSEVGIIPKDWNDKKFVDVLDGFSSGATPYRGRPEYYKGNIRWITSGELKYNIIYDTLEKINEKAMIDTNLKLRDKGTFLMAITGLEAEGTRGSCGIIGTESTTNQSCMALIPKDDLITTEYLFHYYVQFGEFLALKYCQGTKQQSYNASIVKSLPIVLPPTKKEQTAIAKVLSDTDELISSLEKLIEKKKLIKQGTMQQLLTGKKRLPGFNEKWELKRLGGLGSVYGGLSGKSKVDFENGVNPYIPFLNIMNNPIIDINYFDYVNIKPNENQNKALKGDLFFNGSSETPEEVGMCSVLMDEVPNLHLNSFCFGFRLFPEVKTNGLYLSYYFRSSIGRKLFFSLAQGATRHNLSKSSFLKIEFPLPKPDEQLVIANVISEMDSEIVSLEQKSNKYKSIKQGMMQNLLTGRIRLVKPSSKEN